MSSMYLFFLRGFLSRILSLELVWSSWSTDGIVLFNYKLYVVLSAAFVRSPRQTLCVFLGELRRRKVLGF